MSELLLSVNKQLVPSTEIFLFATEIFLVETIIITKLTIIINITILNVFKG